MQYYSLSCLIAFSTLGSLLCLSYIILGQVWKSNVILGQMYAEILTNLTGSHRHACVLCVV